MDNVDLFEFTSKIESLIRLAWLAVAWVVLAILLFCVLAAWRVKR